MLLFVYQPSRYEISVHESDVEAEQVYLISTLPIPCGPCRNDADQVTSSPGCHQRFLISSPGYIFSLPYGCFFNVVCTCLTILLKVSMFVTSTWCILDDLRVFQPDRPSSLNVLDVGCFYYLYQSDWMTSESMLYNSAQALHVMALRTPFNEPFLTHNIRFTVNEKCYVHVYTLHV